MTPIPYVDRPDARQAWLLLAALCVFFFSFLDLRPLGVPSESRYAEIPREMAASGDWVTPRLNGVKYFEKPPLFYWMQSSALLAFGNNEWAVRFWPALLGVAGCMLTYLFGSPLYGRRTALLASVMLATSPLYFALSRVALTDMAVAIFIDACLLCFIVGVDQPRERTRRLLFYGAYVSAALAVLSKGLIGIVIPGAVVLIWLAITGRWAELRRAYIPGGLLLFFAIAAPWHILAGHRTPEFWWFYFVHEHFLRYSTMVSKRYEPVWYFIPLILVGFIFWLPYFVASHAQAIRRVFKAPKTYPRDLFVIIAILFQFIFFSASKSKLPPYILPLFPFMALLAAEYVSQQWQKFNVRPIWLLASVTALLTIVALLAMYLPHAIHGFDTEDIVTVAYLLPWLAAFFGALTLLFCAAALYRRSTWALAAILLASGGLGWWGEVIASKTQFKSVRELAYQLKPMLKEGDIVATYRQYNQDLPFYLQRTVSPVDWKGELEFGMSLEDTSAWIFSLDEFMRLWKSERQVYVFVRLNGFEMFERDIDGPYRIVAQTLENYLVTNH